MVFEFWVVWTVRQREVLRGELFDVPADDVKVLSDHLLVKLLNFEATNGLLEATGSSLFRIDLVDGVNNRLGRKRQFLKPTGLLTILPRDSDMSGLVSVSEGELVPEIYDTGHAKLLGSVTHVGWSFKATNTSDKQMLETSRAFLPAQVAKGRLETIEQRKRPMKVGTS